MTEVSFPFSTSSLATEEQWLRFQRASGTPDGVLDTGYNATGTTLKVTAIGTSNLSISAGEALAGGFYYRTDATISLAVTSNSGGALARKDLVVLRASQSGNAVSIVYITGGTLAPTPTKDPAGNWEMRLAEITVQPGASVVAPADVADRRVFVAPGATLGNTAYRPAVQAGQLHLENDILYVGTTAGWKQVYPEPPPVWRALTLASGWANYGSEGYSAGACKLATGEVVIRGLIKATSNRPDNASILTLPTGYRPAERMDLPIALTLNDGGLDGLAERVSILSSGSIVAPFGPTPSGSYLDLSSLRFFA